MKTFSKENKFKLKKHEMIYKYIENNNLDLEKIMHEYTNYIYVIIKNSASNLTQEDVEEIISDVFLSLWNNQKKLDINKEISPYIAGITIRLIKKKYRDIRINENIDDFQEKLIISENIDIYSESEENNEMIIKELDKLKDEEKNIFLMFYYGGRKIKEIAEALHISKSKVKMNLFRTRKKLKNKLQERGYGKYE